MDVADHVGADRRVRDQESQSRNREERYKERIDKLEKMVYSQHEKLDRLEDLVYGFMHRGRVGEEPHRGTQRTGNTTNPNQENLPTRNGRKSDVVA